MPARPSPHYPLSVSFQSAVRCATRSACVGLHSSLATRHFPCSTTHYSLPTTHFLLDNSCTNMITCPMLAQKLTLHHPPKQANPCISIRLQPLCPPQKSQPQLNQHLPASFSKTPGVGYSFLLPLRKLRALCASALSVSVDLAHPSLANPNPRHSIHTHSDPPSYSNEPFGKESRQNLCGTMRLMRLCRTKPKIPIVAVFASERADQQQRAHDSFKRAPSPRPAHQVAAATWARILFAKTYETHRAAFSCAGETT